jgi:putative ABC transport system permease protein
MFRNYLIIALRTLRSSKLFSMINISGLAIGIACTIILYLFISDELGYDAYHKNAGSIYRVYVHATLNGTDFSSAKTGAPTGEAMLRAFPEVESFTRLGYQKSYDFRYGDKTFREYRVYNADSNYFEVFSQKVIAGNPKALAQPNHIVITRSTAEKYFGKGSDSYREFIGKMLTVDNKETFVVSAVMEDFPAKSHFDCDILLSMANDTMTKRDQWLGLGYTTFLLVKNGTDPKSLEQKMIPVVNEKAGPELEGLTGMQMTYFNQHGNEFRLKLQPLRSIYLYSRNKYGINPNTEWGSSRTGNIVYVRIFAGVAFFVLMIAVFNFINLSTARSQKRGKEVGVRKTLGSGRTELIWQFIFEAIVTTAFAVALAFLLVELALPWFNQLSGKELSIKFNDPLNQIPAVFMFTLLVGLLAGSYPAFFLSAFEPVDTLKGVIKKRKPVIRNVLVVTQFAISIALIIGMIAIRSQLDYLQKKDLGFTKDNLVMITNGAALGDNPGTFKMELMKNSVVGAASSSSLMFDTGVPEEAISYESNENKSPVVSHYLDVDEDFLKTFKVNLKQGRFFDPALSTDSNAVVINESAAKLFPSKKIIGNKLYVHIDKGTVPYHVVGVVQDFNYQSLHQKIEPLAFHLGKSRQAATYITVRVNTADTAQIRRTIETAWHKSGAIEKCNYGLLNNTLANLYDSEKKVSKIATLFSVFAIVIACLGLFGLALFVIEQRTREIGIRKVLGASLAEVVYTLTGKFLFWIAVANLLAWPVAWLVLHNWLQQFAYRVNLSWWMFVGTGVFALLVAMVTISTQAIHAALANPVNSLRSE